MKLVPVGRSDLDAYLPLVRWHLQSFEDRCDGATTVHDFIEAIRSGNKQLWLAMDNKVKAAALTEVLADHKDTVQLTHCAGEDARDWFFLVENIKAWARERGSTAFQAVCRPGWEKYLRHHGFKKTHIVMEAEIV